MCSHRTPLLNKPAGLRTCEHLRKAQRDSTVPPRHQATMNATRGRTIVTGASSSPPDFVLEREDFQGGGCMGARAATVRAQRYPRALSRLPTQRQKR
eukprot:352952-Chlamydomonas_euryale.AAC.6